MNNMFYRIVAIIFIIVMTDFFLFPLSFNFSPNLNTKTIMAVCGIGLIVTNTKDHRFEFWDKTFMILSLWAIGISLACFISVVVNATNDYTYVTYIISMWVWLFAAYTLIRVIACVHTQITLELIANYLTIVCVIQGICVLGLSHSPTFLKLIDNLNIGLILTYPLEDRVQGISAALDPAGVRFAGVLIIIGYVCTASNSNFKYLNILYLASFIFITVTGNMVSRTTIVGTGIAILYWILLTLFGQSVARSKSITIWKSLIVCSIIMLPFAVYFYENNEEFKSQIRFGFEGFFSLFENGSWRVNSNEILKNMIVFPDDIKTWLIGDGYIENPSRGLDPYYVGEKFRGYYMNTDIGYLRFIFYCGLPGLICFSGFILYAAKECMMKFNHDKILFVLLALFNFCVWMKVSTDIFQFFALFLAMPVSLIKSETNGVTYNNYEKQVHT